MYYDEEWFEERRNRYELVVTRSGLWSVHDKENHTYTWGMTLDEARHYLRREGIDISQVPIID